MTKPLPAPGVDGKPYDLKLKQGQTVVLHSGTKVILRAVATKDTRYFTAWQSIVGTMAEVNAKLTELKLS